MRRRDLLTGASALALASGLPLRARATTAGRKLIIVWVNGGWDVTWCADPKKDLPLVDGPEDEPASASQDPTAEEVRTYGEDMQVQVNDVNRPEVTAFFDKWASKCAIVNGIQVGTIGHNPARFRMLTGTSDQRNPDLSVIVGHALGDALPLGAIDFSGFSLAGAYAASCGRIGEHSQLVGLLDPNETMAPPKGSDLAYPLYVPTSADAEEANAILGARMQRYLASRGRGSESTRRIDQYFESQDRVLRFRDQASDILSSLTMGKGVKFGDSLSLSVDLLARGVCQTAFVAAPSSFDSHTNNAEQGQLYESLFAGLNQLLERIYEPTADEEPLEEEVTVAVVSEFTRTPRFNFDLGKDHWPVGSAMLIGGGIRGGRTYGGTTDTLGERKVDLASGEVTDSGEYLTYDALAAGILEICGVDPGDWLPDATPFRGASA